ncbi:heterokaryon incompatibility protein-domain-containing protein [Cladorrhinum sp. PSN332]|nr:heterokaryon incompatibility protein-domain-containing protein [Cladorrhinum sp. PSN332]
MSSHHHDHYSHSQTTAILLYLNQRLLTVSDQNKQNLLGNIHEARHHEENRTRAAATLRQLQNLNPHVARHFHLKPDALSGLALRMIMPADHGQAQDVSSFIVVSYCWHYPEWLNSPYPCAPGWEITQPMMEAVWNVRNSPNEGVWLDRLCINQGNETDKVTHIATMDTIYHSARRMVILLEDVYLEEAEETAGLAYAKFYADMSREIKEKGLEGQAKSIYIDEYFPRQEKVYRDSGKEADLAGAMSFAMKILTARWFTRAWCAHESRMHPHRRVDNPLFMCFSPSGKVLSFEFRFIFYLTMYLSYREPSSPSYIGHAFTLALNDPNPTTIQQLWWRILRLMPDKTDGVSPLQHLISVVSFGCFRKGDLMSIALNTAGIPLFFDGEEVHSVEDIKWMFSLLVVASGDLIPLVTTGMKLRVPDSSKEKGEFVSWVTETPHASLDARVENPLPESITAITAEYIELDLLVFSSQPKKATEESLAIADRIIADHDLLALKANFLASAPQNIQDTTRMVSGELDRIKSKQHPTWQPPHETFLRLTLALSLDAGLDFILSFPSSLCHSTSDYLHGPIDGLSPTPPPAQIISAASSLLAHFSAPESTLPTLTRYFLILLDPRLPFLTVSPRLLSLPPILGSFCLTPSTSNRSYLAVPACLAHLPPWHQYGWVVEPFDPLAPPEDPRDHLAPSPSELAAKQKGGAEMEVEDLVPVLNTDNKDRREAPRESGEWRLRSKQTVYGMGRVWDGEVIKRVMEGGERMEGVRVLRKQRVYGAEDYNWAEIGKGTSDDATPKCTKCWHAANYPGRRCILCFSQPRDDSLRQPLVCPPQRCRPCLFSSAGWATRNPDNLDSWPSTTAMTITTVTTAIAPSPATPEPPVPEIRSILHSRQGCRRRVHLPPKPCVPNYARCPRQPHTRLESFDTKFAEVHKQLAL